MKMSVFKEIVLIRKNDMVIELDLKKILLFLLVFPFLIFVVFLAISEM